MDESWRETDHRTPGETVAASGQHSSTKGGELGTWVVWPGVNRGQPPRAQGEGLCPVALIRSCCFEFCTVPPFLFLGCTWWASRGVYLASFSSYLLLLLRNDWADSPSPGGQLPACESWHCQLRLVWRTSPPSEKASFLCFLFRKSTKQTPPSVPSLKWALLTLDGALGWSPCGRGRQRLVWFLLSELNVRVMLDVAKCLTQGIWMVA